MTPFYKSFLREPSPRSLAAFGKHPGWDDHMDDLGVTTETLAILKRVLYLEGIARNISAGSWHLEPGTFPPFDHLFRWQRGDQCLLGRMVASRDRKNRTFFPLVICAQVSDASSREVEGCVEQAIRQCHATERAEAVVEILKQQTSALRDLPPAQDYLGNLEIDPLLDQVDLSAFRPRKFNPKKSPAAVRFRVTRPEVPIPLEHWVEALRRTKVDRDAPILVLAPLAADAGWLDLIVGEPAYTDFACLLNQ